MPKKFVKLKRTGSIGRGGGSGKGRAVGTPNKDTTELINLLREKNFDPAAKLVETYQEAMEIFHDLANSSSAFDRMAAPRALQNAVASASTLMKYIYPQRKAIDINGGQDVFKSLADIFAKAATKGQVVDGHYRQLEPSSKVPK